MVAWNGTSAGWLGFERDERLCERITATTGIASCTSILAFREIFRATAARHVGLVTPYRDDVQGRIMANWAEAGFPCTAERHLRLQDNFSFAEVPEATVAEMIRDVAREGCDAVAVVCTNMRGAGLVEALEDEIGVPIYDSIAVTVWKSFAVAGLDPARIERAGARSSAASPPLRRARPRKGIFPAQEFRHGPCGRRSAPPPPRPRPERSSSPASR